jgi:hypothetical protein
VLGSGEPHAKNWQPAPAAWVTLGINPGKHQVYCGDTVIAGAAETRPSGTRGSAMFPAEPATP